MLDRKSRDELRKECIDSLSEAKRVLNDNIRKIKIGTKDLKEKGDEIEDTYKSDFMSNRHLIPDFNIISPDLIESMNKGIEDINKFFNLLVQYEMFITPKFEEYKQMTLDKFDRLSKED